MAAVSEATHSDKNTYTGKLKRAIFALKKSPW